LFICDKDNCQYLVDYLSTQAIVFNKETRKHRKNGNSSICKFAILTENGLLLHALLTGKLSF
jgi:hypothetical protein